MAVCHPGSPRGGRTARLPVRAQPQPAAGNSSVLNSCPQRRRDRRAPDGSAPAAVAVSGHGRNGRGAAHRYAEPRDDRRTRRSGVARVRDGGAAACLRPVPCNGRAPLGHVQIRARMAARALSLVWHVAAVRRLCHHALRAARAVERHDRAAARRADRCWARLPARRRRPAYDADRRPRPRDRSRASARAPKVVALLCAC